MQFTAMVLNLGYTLLGGTITLAFMLTGYLLLDRLTRFDTSDELAKGNEAVGRAVAGIFIAIGVSMGLAVGLGLH